MNFELLKQVKEVYQEVENTFIKMEENGWIDLSEQSFDITDVLNYDLVRYIEYLIASDKSINKSEVDVFRFITGLGGETLDSLKANIEKSDVMSFEFQSEPLAGLVLLVDGINDFLIQYPEVEQTLATILAKYLLALKMIGECVISADDTITYNERRDLEAYLRTQMQYIKMKSYIANNELVNKVYKDIIE